MRVSSAAAILAFASWASASRTIVYKEGELVIQSPEEVGEVVLSPRPHEYMKPEAHAAMSSLADRLRIQSKGTQADIIPSIQALLNCGDAGSCNGGDSHAANAWVMKNGGIPDVTCLQYEAKNMECSEINLCRNCNHTFFKRKDTCFPVQSYPKVTVLEYGTVTGDDQIMSEIYARGPVSCYINANPLEEYTGGINEYEDTTTTNHAIQIIRGGFYQPGTCFWAVPGYEE